MQSLLCVYGTDVWCTHMRMYVHKHMQILYTHYSLYINDGSCNGWVSSDKTHTLMPSSAHQFATAKKQTLSIHECTGWCKRVTSNQLSHRKRKYCQSQSMQILSLALQINARLEIVLSFCDSWYACI